MMSDLIKREDAIDAIECVTWYHQNRNKDMVSGANSDEHQAWYKAEDIYDALEAIPSADRPQGEWLKFGLGRGTRILFCTNCERKIEVPLSQGDSNYDFCPNCGARMFAKDTNVPNKKGANDETN
jgi:DNA-directed RNA polymerase subunit RPC12/RpoP